MDESHGFPNDNDPDPLISTDDDIVLYQLGYKKELFRGLGGLSSISLGFTEVSVLVSISLLYTYGIETGGPVSIIFGWIISFTFTVIIAYSLAEICGAFPSAGSVYHWTGQIVPPGSTSLVSYVCGWCNFLGNVAGDASFGYAWATFFNAAWILTGFESLSVPILVGMSIGILFIWSLLNCFRVDSIGRIACFAAIIQIVSILLIIVLIFVLCENLNSASYVFTAYINKTGFSSVSYVLAISLLTSLFGFSGYEASAHMAEETNCARINAPKGIINTCYATGVAGLGYLLALLFATTDIDGAVNSEYNLAVMQVLVDALGKPLATALAYVIMANVFFAGLSSVAVTARITFALVRDNAFPYSQYLAKVQPVLSTPVRAIFFIFAIDAALLLLPLNATANTAFVSITSIATIGFQVSYAIPVSMKLIYYRLDFPETPMSLGGWSIPCGVLSSVWLYGTSFLFFLPTASPVTTDTMNWTAVTVTGFIMVASINWIFHSQYVFHGPKRMKFMSPSLKRLDPQHQEMVVHHANPLYAHDPHSRYRNGSVASM